MRVGASPPRRPPSPRLTHAGVVGRCTVYGHTGNYPGYTAFIATSRDGRRSVTLQASTQLAKHVGVARTFAALRQAFGLGVCAALAG
jgi:D-alanyl-D-alanine carboxypeptidase